jgi:hypothetical protein
MFLCSKLPCQGWRTADFLQGFFAKYVCWIKANKLVLVLRFLCPTRRRAAFELEVGRRKEAAEETPIGKRALTNDVDFHLLVPRIDI